MSTNICSQSMLKRSLWNKANTSMVDKWLVCVNGGVECSNKWKESIIAHAMSHRIERRVEKHYQLKCGVIQSC